MVTTTIDDFLKPEIIEIKLNRLLASNKRFDASSFDLEAEHAIETLAQSEYPKNSLKDLLNECYYPKRFKRNYVKSEDPGSIGFLGSSEMLDILPIPNKFLSSYNTDIEALKVKKNTILMSRSGTIGNIRLTNQTLSQFLVSEHSIRLIPKNYPGYISTYLSSKIGQSIIRAKVFGSVVNQIEPEHILDIQVPIFPKNIIEKIDKNAQLSEKLLDKSVTLLKDADALMSDLLQLEEYEKEIRSNSSDFNNDLSIQNIKMSNLKTRFDASFHSAEVIKVINFLETNKNFEKIYNIGDLDIEVILPGRFKRNYVSENYGMIFIGGKQIWQLDPTNKKYLSIKQHDERIKSQLLLKENMVLITCSGTIGKISFVPAHWNNWTANQHIIRLWSEDDKLNAYISVFLKSKFGKILIQRFTYGSVVDEIDNRHVSEIPIPLPHRDIIDKIADKVLEANNLNAQSYEYRKMAEDLFETTLNK